MKKIIPSVILFILFLLVGCDYSKTDETREITDQISVKFKPEITRNEIVPIVAEYHAQIVKESTTNIYRIKIPPEKTIEEAKKYFESLQQVESVSLLKETKIT